jgi:hypothetical protein
MKIEVSKKQKKIPDVEYSLSINHLELMILLRSIGPMNYKRVQDNVNSEYNIKLTDAEASVVYDMFNDLDNARKANS